MFEISVYSVFIAALITALATGLGAVPFFFIKKISDWWLGVSSAVAAGLMLSASSSLIYEASQYSVERTIFGILLGLFLIVLSDKLLENKQVNIEDIPQADSKKMLLIMGVMTLHSFAEGIGVGVSFGGTSELGVFITTAIAIHNIPEGLAISLVLVPRGVSAIKSAGWSVFSSLPQPIMAIPAFLFVLTFTDFLPIGLGLAAGAMIWMVFSEMIKDALEHVDSSVIAIVVTLAYTAMFAFQYLVIE
ncbi:ZIP family metal transporter [bacterium]|nr:MAG: ZIP family metal transporter [bacterium]